MRLLIQTLVEGSRQQIPYPAPMWDWKCVQSYQWQESQHINVLEFTACLIYFRKACCEKSFQLGLSTFLTVAFAVALLRRVVLVPKVLNRPLRRYCALAWASDSYILPFWIISSWNFSDSGSRVCPRDSG